MLVIWVGDGCVVVPGTVIFLLHGDWKFGVQCLLDTTWRVLDTSGSSEIMVLLGVGNREMLIVYKWCT